MNDITEELARIFPDLRPWAAKFSGPHYDPDDLVADVVIRFLERKDRYDASKGPLKNYLFSCIRNRSLDALKAYDRKGRKRLRMYLRNEIPLYTTDEERTSLEELRTDFEQSVQSLPRRLAEPFRLFALEGKDYHEISELLGVRREYVRALIHRARAKVQERMGAA